MVTIRNYRRSALMVTIFGAVGVAVVSAAAPALAENSINITGAGPAAVTVDYRCDASAGVAALEAMAGDPQADRPAATGRQDAVVCTGGPQSAEITLVGEQLREGQNVQVRVALVDPNSTVISGQAKAFRLESGGTTVANAPGM